MKRAAVLAPIVLLAACAVTPEQRVRTSLVEIGVPTPVAGCMAERMASRLSIGQLKQLKRLGSLARAEPAGKMNVARVLHKMEALGDPEIVSVTGRAAIGCYIIG